MIKVCRYMVSRFCLTVWESCGDYHSISPRVEKYYFSSSCRQKLIPIIEKIDDLGDRLLVGGSSSSLR